ncbi:Stk1 family PASTA domain-containing Ser/Thr kinase [uncultured Corynebacterium sp.]|uniref:Stk1 family PASTA domain-containing Ser/Thr kinase n=1 Tax=uncultured Corynebacterium sp. TaxID=159447 RepID=UPI0025FB6A88|nr:Stk1 family PASTA domain-containing Ser/Thr kinase [uncultured Corynebacterium sp.]
MERIGTTLGGRYRLGAKIGTGGMSDVYAATDELLGRDVAVKMMRPDLARDQTFLERFRREAQNAAKLNHPAIVAVYDTGQTPEEDGSVPYIVMERVNGETLRDIMRDEGKMRLTDAAKVMASVCEALHFSHEAGIIHRDIKPANVMITNTGAVKVMDFGIARALSDSSAAMTQTAAVIGTAQYLSPEQARGKSADSRSDIYAAGCVFFELATGQPPFQGESPFSVAFQHVQDDPMAPSSVPGMHLSKREALSLDSIVLTAMAKSPGDRYDDAQQMATDLRRLSEDQLPLVAQTYAEEDTSTSVMPAAGAAAAGAAGAGLGAGAAQAAGQRPRGVEPNNYYDPNHNGYNGYEGGPYNNASYSGDDGYGNYGDGHYDEYNDGYDEYDEYYEEENRRGFWKPALITLLTLGLLGGVGYAGYHFLSERNQQSNTAASQPKVKVPDVKNLSRQDAEARLHDAGFEVRVTEATHPEIPRGNAITTKPGPNSTVPDGTAITLVISSGREITDTPDLTGMTTEEASQALQKAKLKLNPTVKEESSDDVPAGQVISQNPAQGSQVSVGTKVTITVSTGKEKVRVPVVTGQDSDTARKNLESAGFKVEESAIDSMEDEGTVLSASNEGSELTKGSTIKLEVSKGNMFRMPSLQGKKYSQVLSLLQQAGWRGSPSDVKRKNVKTPELVRQDEVATQSVHAGEIVKRDESIEVGVYVFDLLP